MPTAANAGYYAGIVAEKALLRRLVEAGTRVVQYGYAGAEGADVAEVVDRAQAEIYDVTDGRTSEDFVALEDLLQPTMDEIDAIASKGGISRGVPTGFLELDEVTNGLHPGQMIVIAARPGVGKALSLDTPLPTPTGWTTMGEVAVGDELIGADGKPTRVVAVTDVMHGRPCYRVEFSDGTEIVADAAHQWLTETRASRKSAQAAAVRYNRYKNQRTFAAVRTTHEIADTLRCPTVDRRLESLGCQRQADSGSGSRNFGAALHAGSVAGRRHDGGRPDHVRRPRDRDAHRGRGPRSRAHLGSAKYRYQLLLPEAWPPVPRALALCAVRRSFRRLARSGRAADRAAGAPASCPTQFLRRAVPRCGGPLVRTSTVPEVPQRRGNAAGAAADSRCPREQAHSAELPARVRSATAGSARRTARHRRHGDRRRCGPVLCHEPTARDRRRRAHRQPRLPVPD